VIQLPLFGFEPKSNWAPPTHLPDLSNEKEIAVDTETKDPRLKEAGPGYIRKDGFVAGVGIACAGWKGYFPLAHELGGNLDFGVVQPWLARTLARSDVDYIFANAQYDLGWLRTLGLEVKGRINDIQIADTLIDEENHEGYDLNALAKRWLGETKLEGLLQEAIRAYSPTSKKKDQWNTKADLWRLPARFVGPYGEADPDQTFRIFQKQKPVLKQMGLMPIYELERKVTRVLFEMHWQGIRVDRKFAEELNTRWKKEEIELLKPFKGIGIWNNEEISRFCIANRIDVPRTKDGVAIIQANWLENCDIPLMKQLRVAREINRTRETYLEQNLIQNVLPNGRIHPQYVQIACDEGGTRTGRLSCKNPNAQQFPKRSRNFDAKTLRKCLLPEEGELWNKNDFWSQEPTLQVHYGLEMGYAGAREVCEGFKKKIKLYTQIEKATQGRCNYDQAKIVVLGRSYGMGIKKMARDMGLPTEECKVVLEAFDDGAAYIGLLAEQCQATAQKRGFIKTILGRQRHFNYWGPRRNWDKKYEKDWQDDRFFKPYQDKAKAEAEWGAHNIERAWCRKAFNALCQGGGADQTKKGMVDVFEAVGVPALQVHDEVNKSVPDEKTGRLVNEILVNAIKLRAPIYADFDLGPTWQ
jgi:DNA polymerase I-like protein with 3'-5' exonuclease and polymerase domains